MPLSKGPREEGVRLMKFWYTPKAGIFRKHSFPVFVLAVSLALALAIIPLGVAQAKEPATPELTLNEAICRALEHSLSLQMAQLDIEKKEALREQAAQEVTFTPIMGAGGYSPAYEAAWYNLLGTDLQWQMSKKSYAAAEDSLVLDVCQQYWNVLEAEDGVQVAELGLKKAETAVRNAQFMALAGILSQADLTAVKMQLEQAKSNLAAAQTKLNSAYESFNRLVGLWPEDRPVLTEEPSYSPVEVTSIQHEVSRVLETSPEIWKTEHLTTLAQWNLSMPYTAGRYTPYEARRAELEAAELTAAQARELTEKIVRSLFNSLQNIEETIAATKGQITLAEERARVAQVKFDAGLFTQSEILTAKLEVAQAQASLDKLIRQYAYLKMAFQKPWAFKPESASGAGAP